MLISFVGSLLCLNLAAHQLAIIVEFLDIDGTDVHKQSHISLPALVGIEQLLVQFVQECILAFYLPTALDQTLVHLERKESHGKES